MTDNKNFSEFGLMKIPKLGYNFKKFKLNKKDIKYLSDTQEIKPKSKKDKVFFDGFFIDKLFIDYFTNKYGKDIKYKKIKTFMGVTSDNLIGIFKNQKLIGILKTKKEN